MRHLDADSKNRFMSDGQYLYCPRSKVNTRALRFGLAYGDQPSEAVVMGDHVRVPRHYPISPPPEVEQVGPRIFPKWAGDAGTRTAPRDYQLEPLEAMKVAGGGILNLGCGYGKTVVACYYMSHLRTKTAVLVDKINLLTQWEGEIEKHLLIPNSRIGRVRGKTWDWEDKDIVLISLRTMSLRGDDVPEGFYESFGLVIFDECHHLAAPTFKAVVPRFYGVRLGLSATPKREDGLEAVFENHLGEVFYSRIEQELTPRIIFHETEVDPSLADDPDAQDRTGEIHYRKLCACLGKEQKRNQLALDYVKALHGAGHHVLCLSASVQHVKDFKEDAEAYIGEPLGVASGSVKGEERAEAISSHRVSVGTMDVASEALNVPSLSALLIMSPFGARQHGNVLQQTLGRIQRVTDHKKPPVCIILADSRVGMCRGLTTQLKRALRSMEYTYETREAGTSCTL